MHRTDPPQQRMIWPKPSVVPRLRNPALGQGHDSHLADGHWRSRLMTCLQKFKGFPVRCQGLGCVAWIFRLGCLSRKNEVPRQELVAKSSPASLGMPALRTDVNHG